jgi:hypothetical protein
MKSFSGRFVVVGLVAVFALPIVGRAQDFFTMTANGSGGTSVTDSSGNIINLTNNLITFNDNFFPLAGQNVTASLNWGGVPNAVILTENITQTQATISFPTTGFERTFVGTDAANLQSQIQDFIKGDGERAYAQFLKSMDQLSPVASLDGNPQASTALVATDVFNRLGIRNQQQTETVASSGGSYWGIDAQGGWNRAGGLDGNWANLSLASGGRFGSNVAINFGTTLVYREVGSSEAYTIAEEVALPITILNNSGNGLSWQVSPWAYAGLSASHDQASGGLLVGGGGTSSLALHLGTLTLTLGDQINYTGNIDVAVDGHSFDTDIDQWILSNGLDARFRFPGTPILVEGSITYNNFLNRAAVADYWSPTLGIGFAFGPHARLTFNYSGDFAKNYNNNGALLELVLAR